MHVFSPAAADFHRPAALTDFLARLLRCAADGIALTRDDFGRPVAARPPAGTGWPPGARLCLAAGDDPDRPLLALARDLPVALSVHPVPRGPIGELLLPFTPSERASLRGAPAEGRARRLARLWTRKEAALRLAGRCGLAAAGEVDALGGARDGAAAVRLPASVAAAGGCGPVAYVRDLPAGPDRVACAATPAPPAGIRLWATDGAAGRAS
ncbi:4'-phosphopantetheinyl transferase superfamily protein [Streptomyces sp. RS10V-4]|uniref:4'-phosphopantetheinyl transferase superfamily protein n=1 Tax=Streptomyces rhizoryzae TaxID=2932493 RepID=UPI0020069F85|nr:4'-phosphopantetheinyl transferase superfamily protein [Streptomyces rhizoryzae]MCK7623791.1 4'-phosphopantetheinyl transferase superfamily protein [Streptomyces rhizoryzae]